MYKQIQLGQFFAKLFIDTADKFIREIENIRQISYTQGNIKGC